MPVATSEVDHQTGQLKWACERQGGSALRGKFVPIAHHGLATV
jgi:hypothetical protein